MVKNDRRLLAWYRCESVTGNVLVDELGGNNFTLDTVTLVSGGCPYDGKSAIQFPGTTESIGGGSTWFANQGVQTVAFWFKASKTATLRTMFAHPETAVANRVYVNIAANDVLSIVIGSTTVAVGTASTWTADTWQHIAVVRDAANGKAYAYVNGNLIVNATSVTIAGSVSGTTVLIGGLSSSQFFDGQMDDLRIYNRFLKQAEVRGIMYGTGYAK